MGDAQAACKHAMLTAIAFNFLKCNPLLRYTHYSTDNGFGVAYLRGSKGPDGELSFNPTNISDSTASVNELALLLTAGRMSHSHRNIIAASYANFLKHRQSASDVAKLALSRALKLFMTSSSFHSTNLDQSTGVTRRQAADQVPSRGRPFKALVVLFLQGGADSFNLLVS